MWSVGRLLRWGLFLGALYFVAPYIMLVGYLSYLSETEDPCVDPINYWMNERESVLSGDAIKPLKLYAQLTHKRDRDTGCVELGGAPLNVREVETVKADPFGAAKVDIYDEIDVGRLNVTPL